MQQLTNRQFTFHNAGQGLFYSGNINGFEFVYDCGSDRKQHLTDLVLNYKAELRNGEINLLMLSHLHEDHVSGLYPLFYRNPKITVERVILPYLSPIERLILAISASAPETGEWYYNFLADPALFFSERGVRQITYMSGGQREPEAEDRYERDYEHSDRFTDKLENSIVLKKSLLDNEPHLENLMEGKLRTKSHNGAIILSANSPYWQFRFFNYKVKPETLKSFSDCVRSTFARESLTEIITNRKKREQLRLCYKSLHKSNFNNTSLLVLHGPLSSPNNYSQLLTGDINLKKHVPEITNHFGRSLSDVSLSLIPHHGSKRNWDKAILPLLSKRCRWVVSTGKTNKTQPCSDILDDIKRQGQAFSICDDDSKLTFDSIHSLHVHATGS